MIDSIIIARALQQISRLTLPDFGTLLKKPEGEIVFSQFLRNDDQVFASIVMNSYQVGAEQAIGMVVEFVADIMTQIATNGEYILPELGYFVSDPSGAIKFKSGLPPQKQQQEEVVVPQQRPQITPQPIVGVPQQQRPLRQQTPYGPRPQQVIPQRQPQQRPQPQRPPQQRQPQRPPQPQNMRPPKKRTSPAKKTDYLLIFAIVVAVAVIVLIIYSLVFADTTASIMQY